MTTEPTKPIPPLPPMKPVPGIPKPAIRAWSTKTLAQQLARYVRDNDIGRDEKVSDLFESLKRSIVAQAIGTSLDL